MLKKMRVLLLNGKRRNNEIISVLENTIIKQLENKNHEIDYILLKDKKIVPCQGCFECWIKTPGICKIDDYGREIVKKMVKSDLIIHLTPITFGGYSSESKKAIDRSIPVLLPFFKKMRGEIHHKQRYEKIASKIVIGYFEEDNDESEDKKGIFKELAYRNSLNMAGPVYEPLIYTGGQNFSEFKKKFDELLKKVEKVAI
ncbi:MAG: NADPH-dependent FMN reductase [Promethearchaeota archaeon]|nr:MAG: NADPH-dependent FMN reductase [Candidatus Lokiarchaeota archaeon]